MLICQTYMGTKSHLNRILGGKSCVFFQSSQSQLILFQGLAKEQSSREEQCNLHLQAKHVEHLGDAVSKNLFLKDKKDRLYLITALASTTVDIKKIALRLGVGKSGIRFAPEETLQAVLQVNFYNHSFAPKDALCNVRWLSSTVLQTAQSHKQGFLFDWMTRYDVQNEGVRQCLYCWVIQLDARVTVQWRLYNFHSGAICPGRCINPTTGSGQRLKAFSVWQKPRFDSASSVGAGPAWLCHSLCGLQRECQACCLAVRQEAAEQAEGLPPSTYK
jgi:hypothetical protein